MQTLTQNLKVRAETCEEDPSVNVVTRCYLSNNSQELLDSFILV